MPGLEQRLKHQDDAPKKQAVDDREHQRPSAQPGPPPRHAGPYAEREHTGEDDHLDDPRIGNPTMVSTTKIANGGTATSKIDTTRLYDRDSVSGNVPRATV
jgi:hypothetical protein